MRDDAPMKIRPLQIVWILFIGWALIKMSVIGYYPDELVPFIIVPLAIGAVICGVDRWMASSSEE